MTKQFKNTLEKLTDTILENKKKEVEHVSLADFAHVKQFESIINDHIIPLIKDSSIILGRSGCSINYYSNELAVVHDSKKRIFIQILFYPHGHSKVTLGVNTPFLQFAYIPAKGNIKITTKISIMSEEGSIETKEIKINDFTCKKIDKFILDFFMDTVKYNT